MMPSDKDSDEEVENEIKKVMQMIPKKMTDERKATRLSLEAP